jgi:hypothetical protein
MAVSSEDGIFAMRTMMARRLFDVFEDGGMVKGVPGLWKCR